MIHGDLVICSSFNIYVALITPLNVVVLITKKKVLITDLNIVVILTTKTKWLTDLFIVVFVTITKKAGNSTHFILHILKLLHHDITTITIQIIHSRQSQFTLITGIISATYCVRYPHAVPF